MRKNIIALMLVLPLLFVFVVFSSGNAASLGVSVSASGIEILNAPDGGLRIDLAEYENDFQIAAEVFPENASDKGYTFRVEEVEGSEFADVTVDEDGTVHAQSAGSARVVAVSNDGAYTDSMTVIVSSSKPYDMSVSLYAQADAEGENDLLTRTEDGYSAVLSTGAYRFQTALSPSGFAGADVETESGFAVIDGDTVLLPFEGRTVLSFTVQGGAFGAIVRRVVLETVSPATASGITVNGAASVTLSVENDSASASFYIQAGEEPALAENENIAQWSISPAEGAGGNGYIAEVVFAQSRRDEFTLTVTAGEGETSVTFSFGSFAFDVRSTLPVQGGDAVMLEGSPVTFYAVPSVIAGNVTYQWTVTGGTLDASSVTLEISESTASCIVTANGRGTFTLVAMPYRNGHALDVFPEETELESVYEVTSVQIANSTSVGLSGVTTLAGTTYANGGTETYDYLLDIRTYRNTEEIDALSDMEITVSDPAVISVTITGEGVYLRAVGTGEASVSVSWIGNGSFGRNVAVSLTVNAVADGVLCDTSAEVFAAADAAKPIVLGADVMLGEDIRDDINALRARLGSMASTYNTEFYKNAGREEEARVSYVIEFRNDVYGNGYTLNAEYFTNAHDSTGKPLLYGGPLDFVSYGAVASVAAQDNIAFLVRTDGVTLYNVVLLGCSDASLEEDGQYKLEKLNNVGTVLEVNADCAVLNCRIRNGRTVVRVYGGNRDGDKYFIESLSENTGCDEERIQVRIEGCVLSQGREFLLKIGANRALRANAQNGREPALTDAAGRPYAVQTNSCLEDEYFYRMYVLTDVTLKDSVLETSGLFAVGLESNFSGSALSQDSSESGVSIDGWAGTGGTSFASVLRLEGDVRMYDWKDISLIDSSTLIEVSGGGDAAQRFSLDIGGMLEFATEYDPAGYGDILALYDGEKVVHGGIAAYGGGRNYAQIDFSGLDNALADLSEYLVNLNILTENTEDEIMQAQGGFLPLAAGTQDFRFYMYGSGSANSYEKQIADAAAGIKYAGISRVSAF